MTFRAVGLMRRPVDVSRHERAEPRLRWCDAPVAYGPPKTLYNRWKCWRDMGVFARIMMGLAEQAPDNKTVSINASTYKCTSYGVPPTVKKGGEGRLIGLTKGGMNTKLHAITPSHGLQANHCRVMDTSGRSIRFFITAGQVSDYTVSAALMNELPEAEWLLAPSHRNYVSTAGQWTEGKMLTGSAKP